MNPYDCRNRLFVIEIPQKEASADGRNGTSFFEWPWCLLVRGLQRGKDWIRTVFVLSFPARFGVRERNSYIRQYHSREFGKIFDLHEDAWRWRSAAWWRMQWKLCGRVSFFHNSQLNRGSFGMMAGSRFSMFRLNANRMIYTGIAWAYLGNSVKSKTEQDISSVLNRKLHIVLIIVWCSVQPPLGWFLWAKH